MLRVFMKKIQPIGSDCEPEVQIKVTLNTPIVGAEPFLGIFFKNAPQITISETTLPFSQMKKVMDQHGFKNWEDVKLYIEEKYTQYYLQMFQDWNIDVLKNQKQKKRYEKKYGKKSYYQKKPSQ